MSNALKAYEGVDWSEPPHGLIRSVMKREGIGYQEARRRCGLKVRPRKPHPVGNLQPGTVFWFNSMAWRLDENTTDVYFDQQARKRVAKRTVKATPVASKVGREHGPQASFAPAGNVDLHIPEEAREHLPDDLI